MKKALKKEIMGMLATSINITLNSIDEKAASKIAKSVERAAEKLTKKFAKRMKVKGKLKNEVKQIVGKKKSKGLAPVEKSTSE